MRILVTGSVCAGKTTFSCALKNELAKLGHEFTYWNISDIVLANNLYITDADNERLDTHVVDEDALITYLKAKLPETPNLIVDHHSFDIFRSSFFDLIILVTCVDDNGDFVELHRRLVARKYNEEKITENILVCRYGHFESELKRMRTKIVIINTVNDKNSMLN